MTTPARHATFTTEIGWGENSFENKEMMAFENFRFRNKCREKGGFKIEQIVVRMRNMVQCHKCRKLFYDK